MSSVYFDSAYGGAFPSSRANDGNKDPMSLKVDNSCVHTLEEVNPWWAVDLGALLAVVGVLFANRADNLGSYNNYCTISLRSRGIDTYCQMSSKMPNC